MIVYEHHLLTDVLVANWMLATRLPMPPVAFVRAVPEIVALVALVHVAERLSLIAECTRAEERSPNERL